MNKKILLSSAIIAGMTLIAASSYAASGTSTTSKNIFGKSSLGQARWFGGHMGGPMGQQLTDAEKTALESMTDSEKQAFFEKKHTEMQAKMEARETVIDKLLAGTALTTEEEALRKTLITERAEMKAERTKREAEMKQLKAILDKKKAGTTLTTDEQAILENMPKFSKWNGGKHGRTQMN